MMRTTFTQPAALLQSAQARLQSARARRVIVTIAGAGCLGLSASFGAEHASGPIDVQADSFEAVLDERKLLYHGNVRAQQGAYDIRADTMEVLLNRDNEVVSVSATGSPASVTDDQQTPAITIAGSTIEYDLAASAVHAEGNAEFRRGGDRLSSERIDYSLSGRRATATRSADEPIRLLMQRQP